MKLKYDKLLGNEISDSDFWPSFTDMLTTILLVVILAFSTAVGGYASKLKETEKEINEQSEEIDNQSKELSQAKNQIKSMLGVKEEIIESLEETFEENNIAVRMDQDTGDIHVDSNILFDYESAELKPEAKAHLKEFMPIYIDVLFEYNNNIEEIIVEGHTDDSGSYIHNLELSQNRALSVVRYILSNEFGDFEHKEEVRDKITANGRSYSYLIKNEDGTVNADESRRVVFKFRTTLENTLKENLSETLE